MTRLRSDAAVRSALSAARGAVQRVTRRCALHTALALLLTFACSAAASAQSVRGRVLDAQTDSAIVGARVVLLRGESTLRDVVSGPDGRFVATVGESGQYRLRASFIGYRTVTTDSFPLGSREQIVVDIRMSSEAIQLDPLTIVARRADPRHEPTEEGMYARRLSVPPIGTARVILPLDGEMVNARDARDVLQWLPRPRGCVVVYWNGTLVTSADMAQYWMETPTAHLEGVEFYGWQLDAPAVFREVPSYLIECPRHSVLALWPRSGRYLTEWTPPPASDFSWRSQLTPVIQHISGTFAPGIGAGVESSTQWPVHDVVSVGVHLRRTLHRMSDETMADMTSTMSGISYELPPGERTLGLWVFGVEPRVEVLQYALTRIYVSGRIQAAHRSVSLVRNDAQRTSHALSSWGGGAGMTAGAELQLRPRLAVFAGVGADRIWFRGYADIDPALTETAATWTVSRLRLGITYSSAH